MRETEFIRRNEEKWRRYEAALERDDQDPELLRQLYVHTTDDLSYSRTFYPNRSVRVYLNNLAQRTFLQVYRGRRGETSRFLTFWTDELPRVVYRNRRSLLVAVVAFILSMLIGIVSYRIDPEFAEVILGEYYVDMTLANIENNDPMAVYKQRGEFDMSLGITLNNIMVALKTFVFGVFFAVGSLVIMISNGVMLGVFQYFFYDKGIFLESFSTIWIHGALEISSIVIAGGAGLTMGSGLLFPGTKSRFTAFKETARDGLKIMLGTVPLFIIAGFLEGYLTRHTELAMFVRLAFILLCFAFVFWYYWWYPRVVAGRPELEGEDVARVRDNRVQLINRREIRTTSENLNATITILRRSVGKLMSVTALVSLVFVFLSFYFFASEAAGRYVFTGWWSMESFDFQIHPETNFENFFELMTSFSRGRGLAYFLLVTAGFYAQLRLSFALFWKSTDHEILPPNWRSELFLFLVAGVIALLFAFHGGYALLFFFLAFPFLLTYAYVGSAGLGSLKETFSYVYTHLAASYGLFLIILVVSIPLLFVLDASAGSVVFTIFDWTVVTDEYSIENWNTILQAFVYYFYFALVFIFWTVALILNFYSVQEIDKAGDLLDRIEEVGTHRRLRGMEIE